MTAKSKPGRREVRADHLDVHETAGRPVEPGADGASDGAGQASLERAEGIGSDARPDTCDSTADLDALRSELAEANTKWLRALADLDNYRKRVDREKARWDVESRETVILPLLDVVDNFERALDGEASGGSASDVPFREGVELIFRHLMDVLEKAGVRPVETEGVAFDPNVHEAVGRVESDEHAPDEIVQVMQKGYTLGERLLRPSRVIIAS
jgi:molecular chaperone GrpE